MINDDDIKTIIGKADSGLVVSLMCDVIQRFIYDKTKEEIQIKLPIGSIVPNATFAAGQVVTDVKLMSMFYAVAKKHYIEEFNKEKV